MALSSSTRAYIAGMVQNKRTLQNRAKDIRERKAYEIKSINYSIKMDPSVNGRRDKRNRKTQIIENFRYQLDGIRKEINSLADRIRSARS